MSKIRKPNAAGGPSADRAAMAGIAALMYTVGGLVVYVSLLLPLPEDTDRVAIFGIGLACLVAGPLIWLGRGRLPEWFFHVTTASGTVLTALAVHWGGGADSPYTWFILFVAVFSSYFFSLRATLAHVALAGLAYALAIASYPDAEGDAANHWLVSMAVLGVASGVILSLVSARRRLEDEREGLLLETMELARTDPLTSLPNRRAWHELLEFEVSRARRSGEPLCVAMVDLDHFKRYNDKHGHLAGDDLLRTVAAEWSGVIRPTDMMARYGGEEFAVLLPECGLGDAIAVIERLRERTPRGQRCSAGLARWDPRESPTQLIARADARLYEAKKLGRDRVVPRTAEAVFQS